MQKLVNFPDTEQGRELWRDVQALCELWRRNGSGFSEAVRVMLAGYAMLHREEIDRIRVEMNKRNKGL